MCGIVGLFAKSSDVEARLGADLAAMLVQLSDRGPDSAGVAFYRDEVPSGSTKLTLYSPDPGEDWDAVAQAAARRCSAAPASRPCARRTRASSSTPTPPRRSAGYASERPDLRVMSAGRAIEVYKEVGRPEAFARQFALDDVRGTHALGHTRMATESRVTTEASHPFSTGLDVCLVHNGSLSNHNRLRLALRREGIPFQTDNDTEVAAGYLAWRMREGASLEQALEGCLDDLDGFYTFLVGTADGFAVLRDPIACKPAVLAETDDWVAMASEYPRDRRPAGRRGGARVGAEPGRRLRLGAGRRVTAATAASVETVETIDLAVTPLRELNQRLHDVARAGTRPAPLARPPPERRARARVRPRRRARGRDRGARRLLLRGHEPAGERPRARERRHGRRGEHDVRPRGRGRQREPVGRRDRARRPARDPRRRVRAVRDLAEGRGRRRPRLGRAPERVHGADRPARRLRRRGRGARRLDLRGAALRRGRGRRRSGPTASRRSCAPSTSDEVRDLLVQAGIDDVDPASFRRYGSARRLYTFHVDNAY